MNEQIDVPETLRAEMRKAAKTRWAKTTKEQRRAFGRMLWARRVAKHQQAALLVRDRASGDAPTS